MRGTEVQGHHPREEGEGEIVSAFTVKTRFYGGAFLARANGNQASSTSSERNAVAALLVKLFSDTTMTMTCKEACALHDLKGWQPGRWVAGNDPDQRPGPR